MDAGLINLGIFLLGCASWALTDYGLNRVNESETDLGELKWLLMICAGSIALIVASSMLVDVTHDWRMVVCPAAQFFCCLYRDGRSIWREHRRSRRQLDRALAALREGLVIHPEGRIYTDRTK